jgi:hypothetical protein
MDVKEYVSILRLQSDHLCNLSVQLATQLEQVEQALTEQGITTYADTDGLLDGVTDLSMVTANIAESFYKRMQAFREKTKRAGE